MSQPNRPNQPSLSKFVASRNFTARLKLDSSGRKGKVVTLIDGLPKNELFLKEMTRELKQKCGAGGTYSLEGKEGRVEIQGDQLKTVKSYLEAQEIRYK